MPVLAAQRATFRAIAETVVPESAALDERGWSEVEATVEHALSLRPPRMQRQLRLLLHIIERMPLLTRATPFSRLDIARRTQLLEKLELSPVLLIRRGVWGVRTLVLMGFYTRPETMKDLGYRAHARGWDAREAVQ